MGETIKLGAVLESEVRPAQAVLGAGRMERPRGEMVVYSEEDLAEMRRRTVEEDGDNLWGDDELEVVIGNNGTNVIFSGDGVRL